MKKRLGQNHKVEEKIVGFLSKLKRRSLVFKWNLKKRSPYPLLKRRSFVSVTVSKE